MFCFIDNCTLIRYEGRYVASLIFYNKRTRNGKEGGIFMKKRFNLFLSSVLVLLIFCLNVETSLANSVNNPNDASGNQIVIMENGSKIEQINTNLMEIEEYGEIYTVEILSEEELAVINSNIFISLETYFRYAKQQALDDNPRALIFYVQESDKLSSVEIFRYKNVSRAYGELPTAGYKDYIYAGYIRYVSATVYISATASIIAGITGFWKISLAAAKVFVKSVYDLAGSGDATVYNKTWQAMHKKGSCSAVKQKLVPAVYFKGQYFDSNETIVEYFWAGNPSASTC